RSYAKRKVNPKTILATRQATKRYDQRHPGNVRQRASRRRARIAQASVREDIDLDVLYKRDKGICSICHTHVRRTEASHDHIITLSKGGEHSYRNAALAHIVCNIQKNNRIATQQMRLF